MSRPQPEPMTSVAGPVFDTRRVVAAVSALTRSEQLEPAALVPAVIAVTRAISRAISAPNGPGLSRQDQE